MPKISDYPKVTTPPATDTVVGTHTDGVTSETVTFQLSEIFNAYRIPDLNAPSTAVDAGERGEIGLDANYVYFCTAAGSWKRAPLTTWPAGMAYTIQHLSGRRTLDLAATYTLDEVMQLLGQLIVDLQTKKILE